MRGNEVQQGLLQGLQKRDPKLVLVWHEQVQTVKYLRGKLADFRFDTAFRAGAFAAAHNFLADFHPLFGIKFPAHELVDGSLFVDPLGIVHLSLQQQIEDVPVEGGAMIMHYSGKEPLYAILNKFIPSDVHKGVTAGIGENEAAEAAKRAAGSKFEISPDKVVKLLLVPQKTGLCLCWRVKLYQVEQSHPICWYYDVDAQSGDIVQYYSSLRRQESGKSTANNLRNPFADFSRTEELMENYQDHDVPVEGCWGIGYYSRGGTINASKRKDTYILRDQTRYPVGPVIETYKGWGKISDNEENNWNRLKPTVRKENQGPEVDAHRYAGKVVDYFLNVHKRNSYDNKGSVVRIVVHYDQASKETLWDDYNKLICISDNDREDVSYDFDSDFDTVAHEFTHGINGHQFNPKYQGESGAIDEALADCFAAFITGSWFWGKDSWLLSSPAARNLTNPTNCGQYDPANPQISNYIGNYPDHYSERYQYRENDQPAYDLGGVHCNSTILSHAVYLLSNGGTHRKTGIKVKCLGKDVMEVILYNVQNYQFISCNRELTTNFNFFDFRLATLTACHELFPNDMDKYKAIETAFDAVGISQESECEKIK